MLVIPFRTGKRTYACALKFGKYDNGRTTILLVDHINMEPLCKATVNIPEISLGDNEVIIKDYAENKGVLSSLSMHGIISVWKKEIQVGFVKVYVCDLLVDPTSKMFYQY